MIKLTDLLNEISPPKYLDLDLNDYHELPQRDGINVTHVAYMVDLKNICKSIDRRALLTEFLQANVITTMTGPSFKCPSCNLSIQIYRLDITNPRRLLLLIWNHITGACYNCANVNDLGYDLIDIGIILDEYN
jgi:hypothetical protein